MHSLPKFGRQNSYEIRLAETSDHLPVSWAAGGSHLLLGSSASRKWRRRQLDHTGFPGTYLLDLHHVYRHGRHRKFDCCPVIPKIRSVAHSRWVNAPSVILLVAGVVG